VHLLVPRLDAKAGVGCPSQRAPPAPQKAALTPA